MRRDNDQRCDSIEFTTKAGRAGQTSGPGLGRFGHQPYLLYVQNGQPSLICYRCKKPVLLESQKISGGTKS